MISRFLLSTALVGTIAISSVSCDTNAFAVNKDFSGGTISLAVPPSAEPGEVAIIKEGVETKLRQSLEDFDISEDQLKKVGVKSVVARIIDPNNEYSFDNLTNIMLVFRSTEMGDVEIASLPDAEGTEAELIIADSELKEFLLSDSFDAVLTGVSNAGVSEGVMAEIDVTYEITAGL